MTRTDRVGSSAALALGALITAGLFLPAPASAQTMKLLRPANSGLPGEEVRTVSVAPDGLVWVGARWPFWAEGGFGLYDRNADLWTAISNVDGSFASAFPNDVDWAPDGSVWVATGNGLAHGVDGQWTVYTSANSPLLHDNVADVDVAPNGDVWLNNTNVNNQNAAIFRLAGGAGGTWTRFEVGGALPWALPWKQLADVKVDHLGHAWVANETLNGVAEYDGSGWMLHGAGVGRFGEIEEDTAGNIWLRAGVGGGNSFWRFDHATFKAYPIGTTPTSIGIDTDGSVYLGDWGGTIRKSTNFGQSFTTWVTGLNQVFNIAPDPSGPDVWIGTNGALGHFSAQGALIEDFNTWNTGMPDYFVDRFDLDSDGNLWLASGEAGLSRFDGLAWRNWGAHNVGSEPYPFAGNEPMGAFHLDSHGVGWMGGNGIARWHPETGAFDGFWNWQNNPGMGVTLFEAFAEDRNGKLFAFTEYASVFAFDPQSQLWVKEPVQPYAVSGLPGVATDSAGHVWVCGWFDLYEWDGATWAVRQTGQDLFALGGANAIAIGPDDVIWIGTEKGLVAWDGTTSKVYTTANAPLPTNAIKSVDVRDDGVLGISCSLFGSTTPFPNGVVVVAGDPDVADSWTVWQYGTSPLPHYQLGRVKWDALGNLWVSAISEGVAILLNPSQPLAVDRTTLSASFGGAVELALDAGAAQAGRPYLLFCGASGPLPGTPLPGGVLLPLNWDVLTDLALSLVNTPVFANFHGTLDGQGRATARFDTGGPVPAATGLGLTFAFALKGPWNSVSNPVAVAFTP